MLRERHEARPAWTQGLLFAERMDGDPAAVDRLLAPPGRVPDEARSVLSLVRAVREGSAADRARILVTLPRAARRRRSRPITRSGGWPRRDVARPWWRSWRGLPGSGLSPYDRESLKLDAYASLGLGRSGAQGDRFPAHGQGRHGPGHATILSGHLVRYPDAESAGRVFDLLGAEAHASGHGRFCRRAHRAHVHGWRERARRASMRQEADAVGQDDGRRVLEQDHASGTSSRTGRRARARRRYCRSFLSCPLKWCTR
jgi:hypothetical protein